SSAPFLFSHYFGLDEQQFGWVFGGNAFGLILGSQINRLVLRYFSLFSITFSTSIILAILTLLGLALVFIAPSFWVIYPILFFMLFFIGFQNPNVTALALDPFTVQAGSASALIGSMSMFFGSVFSILVSTFVTESIVPLFYILAACSICSLVLILIYRHKTEFVAAHI
ncbi:MAG: Bcr/CflA family drug resistance efflux transporter, partial [Leeuwenhoekiella sp.]